MSECRRCGKCCRVLVVPFVERDDLKEFLGARGIVWTAESGLIDVHIPHVCPHLVGNDCDLHGGAKPEACRDFPAEGQRCLNGD